MKVSMYHSLFNLYDCPTESQIEKAISQQNIDGN